MIYTYYAFEDIYGRLICEGGHIKTMDSFEEASDYAAYHKNKIKYVVCFQLNISSEKYEVC